MGPELVIVAVASAAGASAIAGLLIGLVVSRWKTLLITVASVACVAGLLNGMAAPSPHQLEAGLIALVFVIVVAGAVAAVVNVIKRGLRALNPP